MCRCYESREEITPALTPTHQAGLHNRNLVAARSGVNMEEFAWDALKHRKIIPELLCLCFFAVLLALSVEVRFTDQRSFGDLLVNYRQLQLPIVPCLWRKQCRWLPLLPLRTSFSVPEKLDCLHGILQPQDLEWAQRTMQKGLQNPSRL